MAKLLLATGNRAKLKELKSLLQSLSCELVTPAEAGISTDVDETGSSLEENARLKATAAAASSRLLAVADDSGLEVEALGGEPGVLSARYAGATASDVERTSYLLSRLEGVPWEKRRARFRCVLAVATPDGQVRLYSGDCPGVITLESRGEMGFGYDPVFYLPQLDRTMAQLSLEEKNRLSHRGQAARKALPLLKRLMGKNIS
ncbi:MAG: XTP/dITP diphosphatase [Dehalococcoidales bacterium]|jgi:XTP/dITP diphosphohydrolase